MKTNNESGKRLLELREFLKLSQDEFAIQINVSRSYLAGIETNKKRVSLDVAMFLNEKYNVSLNWILAGKGEMFETNRNNEKYNPTHTQNPHLNQNNNKLGVDLEEENIKNIANFDYADYSQKQYVILEFMKKTQLIDLHNLVNEFMYYHKVVSDFLEEYVDYHLLLLQDVDTKDYISDALESLRHIKPCEQDLRKAVEALQSISKILEIDWLKNMLKDEGKQDKTSV